MSALHIRITDLRALDGDTLVAVHVLMTSPDGARDARVYYILPHQYAALRLRVGEIDCETVDALEEASQFSDAIRKGLQLLSYGAQSEKTLKQKLRMRGFSVELAAAAAAYLRGQGVMDEGSDAWRIVQSCRRKHWGMRRILSSLFEKGYPESVIHEIQTELEEEDFVPDCVELIRARYRAVPSGRDERQKMTAALARYGYSIGEIRHAMEIVTREDENE